MPAVLALSLTACGGGGGGSSSSVAADLASAGEVRALQEYQDALGDGVLSDTASSDAIAALAVAGPDISETGSGFNKSAGAEILFAFLSATALDAARAPLTRSSVAGKTQSASNERGSYSGKSSIANEYEPTAGGYLTITFNQCDGGISTSIAAWPSRLIR